MTKRNRSISKLCPNNPDGKHKPVSREREGLTKKKYVVVCSKCGKRIGRWSS